MTNRVEHLAEGVTLYLGDCREIMPALGRFDAVVTDPPYGIFKDTSSNGKMFGKETIYTDDNLAPGWDIRPSSELIQSIKDIAKYWTIWGGNYMAGDIGDSKGILVWNKKTGNNSYADGECAFTNTVGTMRILNHQWCGAFKDSERGIRAEHPTQKPIEVMRWCIGHLPQDATKIIDPFMGSGTTGVAAVKLGRQFTGIEIEPKYFDIACRRISEALKEPDMFIEPPKPAKQEALL